MHGDLVRAKIVEAAGPLVREPDNGQAREAGRADGDEHARSRLRRREPVVDHPPHVACVHAHGHHHAKALRRQPREEHRHRIVLGLVLEPGARERAAQHKGEDGQIPRRRHVLDLEPRVREQQAVHTHGDQEGDGEVQPEEDPVADHQPGPAVRDGVLGHSGDDARGGQERGREEEGFGRVRQAGPQRVRPLDEAVGHGAYDAAEHHQVPDVDYLADGLEARESVWLIPW